MMSFTSTISRQPTPPAAPTGRPGVATTFYPMAGAAGTQPDAGKKCELDWLDKPFPGPVIIRFDKTLPDEAGGRLLILEGPDRRHIASEVKLSWWYAAETGRRPLSWRESARAYARNHGMAVLVTSRGNVQALFCRCDLTFERRNGTVVWPPLQGEQRWPLMQHVARRLSWLHLAAEETGR